MTEKQFRKGDYTYCGCSICEIVDEDDEIVCNVVTEDFEKVIGILEENEQLKHDATVLICSNQEYRKENEQLKKAYNDAKSDVEKYEQTLKDIMKDNLLIQDAKKELKE